MVGKTSISTRFIQGKFIKIDLSNRTINTNCFQKRVQINDLIFNLNIWDTAGEEKYHAMAPMFYRGAQGAVVIFDVTKRETFNRATKWFDELKNFAEETKIPELKRTTRDEPDYTKLMNQRIKILKEQKILLMKYL